MSEWHQWPARRLLVAEHQLTAEAVAAGAARSAVPESGVAQCRWGTETEAFLLELLAAVRCLDRPHRRRWRCRRRVRHRVEHELYSPHHHEIELYARAAQTWAMLSTPALKGQRSRLSEFTFIQLIDPNEVRYYIELQQNLTCSFQVIGNFLTCV